MTTLSPEQIACAVEMYRRGNQPQHWRHNYTISALREFGLTVPCESDGPKRDRPVRLNPAGCTLAKMAIALEETRNAAAEYRTCSLMAHVEDVVIFRSVLERLGRGLEKAKELLG